MHKSDEGFRLVFANHPHPMWIYDLKTLQFRDVNEAAVSRYGYSREEFLRMRITDLRPPEDVPRLLQDVAKSRPALQSSDQWRHRLKDGRIIDVKVTSHTIAHAGHKAALVVAEKLDEQYRFFKLALGMLCIATFDGYFTHLNPVWERTLGFTVEELKAKPFIEFVHPEDREATIAEAQKLMTGVDTIAFENRYLCKDGTYKWLLWSATVSKEEQLYYAVARDNTSRKQSEEAIRQAKEEAERANRVKSEFLSRMSHELRTPLNAVIGFSEMLLERVVGGLTAKQEEFLRDIRDSGMHLLALINDILDISKVEAGRMELTFVETDLREVVEAALTTLGPLIGQKHLDVSTTLDPSLTVIRADKIRLKQILYNLLSNAAKFTPEGGQIRVEVHQVSGDVELAVVDTGPGIAAEDQAKLFQEFSQVQVRQVAQEGTGLGLSLVRRLVDLHGGRVWVESEVGKGSRFIVRLPLAAAAGPLPRGSRTVLIVEDDPAAQTLFAHHLAKAGYHTEVMGDGEGVVEKVKALRPLVICLDIRLPGVEDWEILRRLKDDPETAPIPVVVATVLDDAQQAFALGAAQFLLKPVRRKELLDAVAKTVRTLPGISPTVLVVDDDPRVLAFLPPILEHAGYQTVTAAGGREGISLAQRRLPQLIVLDLIMPEVNGFDVIAAVRSDVRTRGIPILVLTAKDLTAEERTFLQLRVQRVALKGSTPPRALVEEVDRVLLAIRGGQ